MESDRTISDLLMKARAGDRQALDRLFALCRNYVALLAQNQVESWLQAKVDPSDLVQQTFLEAHRGFRTFQGTTGGEWFVWLRRILTHNALDFARRYCGTDKRQIRREMSLDAGASPSSDTNGWQPADSADSPSQELLAHERELLLADALAQLAPDHREVICLRNIQGLSFNEIAERMNRTRPATQMLWMRAIQKLQEQLQQPASRES